MPNISTCLWFDDEGEEAAKFYASLFKNSKILTTTTYPKAAEAVAGEKVGSVMTVEFEIEGKRFTALNGGPVFKKTPAISFFIHCDTPEEVDAFWSKLSDGGTVRMELGEYPYSKRYGWVEDRFGVNWQVMLVKEHMNEKIVPSFLFVDQKFGKAEEAMTYWESVFPESKTIMAQKAPPGPPYDKEGALMYGSFTLLGQTFTAMDGPGKHGFDFTEGVSLMINCESQEEVDAYWSKLTANGGEESMCGWLKDKYGVSWQVTPTIMGELMSNPATRERAMAAMLTMKKLDIAAMKAAVQ